MRLDTGIKRMNDGVEQVVFVECYRARYPYDRVVKKVIAEPTPKGKRSEAYRAIKREMGDDWMSDLTDNWFEPDILPFVAQEKISKMLDDLA